MTAGRRGARSKAEIDQAFLDLLEAGTAQSRTHVEQMSMQMSKLLRLAFPEVSFEQETLDNIPFIARLRRIGALLHETYGSTLRERQYCWVSDTVRGWTAMAVAADVRLGMDELLCALRPFATDRHFAVREWAWLAARPRVVIDPDGALVVLDEFFRSPDAFDRRFAVELTRPRSVWGEHIPRLKEVPEIAEVLLGALKCDPSPYVRTAVSNWLRDAGRSRPDWTASITARWSEECACRETSTIVRRARSGL
jgi:3-methyladenine DNA glycosylase AlkC